MRQKVTGDGIMASVENHTPLTVMELCQFHFMFVFLFSPGLSETLASGHLPDLPLPQTSIEPAVKAIVGMILSMDHLLS